METEHIKEIDSALQKFVGGAVLIDNIDSQDEVMCGEITQVDFDNRAKTVKIHYWLARYTITDQGTALRIVPTKPRVMRLDAKQLEGLRSGRLSQFLCVVSTDEGQVHCNFFKNDGVTSIGWEEVESPSIRDH